MLLLQPDDVTAMDLRWMTRRASLDEVAARPMEGRR